MNVSPAPTVGHAVSQPPFEPGETIVHPKHGVGRVESIGSEVILGQSLDVVLLTFPDSRMTVRVPLSKAASSGIRRLSSPERMRQAFSVVDGKPRVSRLMWSRRAQEYAAKINSGDPMTIAEVVRDLKRNLEDEKSYSERQVFEAAMSRLCEELAAVEGSDRASTTARVIARMSQAKNRIEAPAMEAADVAMPA